MPAQDDEDRKVFPVQLSSAQIVEAVHHSPDGGITLFLSKLNLSDIAGNEATELALARRNGRREVESVVERLALGNNHLTTLPTEFALLTHLRYLNLKHNSFTSFPDALTTMPSLDTLDLSCNRIKGLPPHPGNLIRLKIFSLSRNKITKLPTYFAHFRQLEVLQVDRNPIDWPPASALETFGDPQDFKNGKEWTRNLQVWMDAELCKGKEFDDSGYGEQPDWIADRSDHESWKFPLDDKVASAIQTPHARSFSIDSDVSTSSIFYKSASDIDVGSKSTTSRRRPMNLATNTKLLIRPSESTETFSTTYTPSPISATQLDLLPELEANHFRTASHASTFRKPHTSAVAPKQSLPDLRTTKEGRRYIPASTDHRLPVSRISEDRSFHAHRKDSNTDSLSSAYDEDVAPSNSHVVPLVTVERSSYFRRSSTIPTNHSLPNALQTLLFSARGILFALGQLYQTLDQHIHQDGNERLLTNFRKVLDPANVTMLHLIRSLDRFDDVGQRSTPSPAVCRALVESCRDTVSIFRKAVGVITMQMEPENSDDARYVRWLILELYAATAELCHAWQSLVSQLESLRPFFNSFVFLKPSFGNSMTADISVNAPATLADPLAPSVRLRPLEATQAGRTRTARRHAGSFSTKDVQIGKELPSYDFVQPPSVSLASDSQAQKLKTPMRQVTVPVVTTSTPTYSISSYYAPSYFGSISDSPYHQRGLSQSSLPEGVLIPSPHDSPLVSSQGERTILQAVQQAVTLAPTVWDQIQEVLRIVTITDQDTQESIDQARSITKRLSDDVAVMSDSEGCSDADKRLLRENAHLFLKALVQLSNILKTHGSPRSVPAVLRANMVKLTNFTEEFAILLHVSSVSSYTSRSYSPISNAKYAPYNSVLPLPEENPLPPSLSRSRSEQPTVRSLKPPSSHGGAASLSSSRNSGVRRLRLPREPSTDILDPG